jgi:adenine/guanine phosphoribosyltransferase-like PRPP-binding protein
VSHDAKFLDYMGGAILPAKRRALVRRAKNALADVDFDTFVGTGVSGALVVPMLADAMRKNFLLVRKDGDSPHAAYSVVGTIGERWIFVDDFISGGATIRRVWKAVAGLRSKYGYRFEQGHTIEYVGACLYNHLPDRPFFYPAGSEPCLREVY